MRNTRDRSQKTDSQNKGKARQGKTRQIALGNVGTLKHFLLLSHKKMYYIPVDMDCRYKNVLWTHVSRLGKRVSFKTLAF